MKLVTANAIEAQKELVNRYAHQILQPRHTLTIDGVEVTVCWIGRLNRAENVIKGKGEEGQKALAQLIDKWETLCSDADKAYQEYKQMCKTTNTPMQERFITPPCPCIGCETVRKHRMRNFVKVGELDEKEREKRR